ncbi:helix-turn-helix transcriptional regulator [Adlercreutzia sp. R25]|uniref:Helix-turn-helix transcriptional regulator n=1 Tax=Adlercreutzia shanghongiae TaxID=3111773 RepID=A0ABU6IZV9_9ACTN|nr:MULTISPECIES: helix-turn-helix transcriptional regulator [unclassified Adlercreutzia]MEC4273163.1 helix-turn-helix transcriptional regulator [Adlercreutzia sp. R25]MEC4295353.1 helix-turn-helix transcriptional regulator [Adlercreutzia sp. R22]
MAKSTNTARQGAIAKLEGTLKFRYLGIGFIWAWVYGSYETSAVYPLRLGSGINADASWLVSAIAVTVVLFLAGVVLGRRRGAPPAWLAAASAVCAGVGTLASSLSDSFAIGVVASGLLTGFGTALLNILWGQALAQLDEESAELAIPAASIIMVAGALVFPYLPPGPGTVATATLPVASGALLLLTYRDQGLSEQNEEGGGETAPSLLAKTSRTNTPSTSPATIVRIALLLFVTYFATSCVEAMRFSDNEPFSALGVDWPALIGSACGIALMAAFLLFARRPSFDELFKLLAPLVTLSLALLPWADLWAVLISSTVSSVTNTILTVASFLYVVTAARRGLINAALGIGITQGALQLGVLCGNVLGLYFGGQIGDQPYSLFAVAFGLMVVFSLAWVAYPADRRVWRRPLSVPLSATDGVSEASTSFGAQAKGALEKSTANRKDAARTGDETPGDGRTLDIDDRCRMLSEAHGLSGREAEILGYLARGRSQPYIREELVLSKNTVATHVKHIYQKLNVHSRQELLDLFEAR